MIRTIIVDDESHCIYTLTDLLRRKHATDIEVVASYSTLEDAFSGITQLAPELLFLDIEINGRLVFDLLNQLGEMDFNVVFTTAYEKYAVKAFKFCAIDYLVKPIDPDDLDEAVNRVKKDSLKHAFQKKYNLFLQELTQHTSQTHNKDAKRISMPTLNGVAVEDIDEIIRCESSKKNIIVYLKDKRIHTLTNTTLNKYEDMLSGHKFYRVHDSHLINVKHIKEYIKDHECVLMSDGSRVYVSDRKKKAFKSYLSGLI